MVSNGNSFSNGQSMSLGTEVREPWLIRMVAGTGEHWA
jgi:hypothetical protein